MNDYFVFILTEKASFPIDWMCQKLKVSRASFYRWLRPNVPTPTQVRHDELDAHVVRVYTREKGRAGRDQITTILGLEGVNIACGTVGSILGDHGLRAVRMRAWKNTTTVAPDARTEHIQNHMLDQEGTRDFTSTVPGTRFCGDITYLRTGSGWLYLATVIDLCTRMVVGWSMASHMRTSLIIGALEMARDHGHLDTAGAIFHSDRGAQGGFNRWKQHLDYGGGLWDVRRVGWPRNSGGSRCGRRADRRADRRAGRRGGAGNTGRISGTSWGRVSRARRLASGPACRR
ncbi:hypothetical protein E3T37_16135, partial [Cryobacterium sp. TMT2-10]|uniref:DDE-type integrase/transposase/recombinase n=1 Tax=Cryobacterium sp. TMT2-10 TaxID=1259244 RepID=UPI0011015DDF